MLLDVHTEAYLTAVRTSSRKVAQVRCRRQVLRKPYSIPPTTQHRSSSAKTPRRCDLWMATVHVLPEGCAAAP